MTEPAERPACRECGQPLLLIRPGRETCAQCDSKADRDPFAPLDTPPE